MLVSISAQSLGCALQTDSKHGLSSMSEHIINGCNALLLGQLWS
jgi:hypothetical protein